MDTDQQFVIFQLAAGSYAMDIASVQEIIRLPTLTMVPHIVGITNLRGSIVPVLDMPRRCELSAAEPTAATWVVVQHDAHNPGLMVDSVGEVAIIPASAAKPVAAPLQKSYERQILPGVAQLEERLIVVPGVAQLWAL